MKISVPIGITFLFLGANAALASASQFRLTTEDFNFSAPSVPNTGSVADKQVGTIVYDASSNQFKGLDSSGNWDSMTNPGSCIKRFQHIDVANPYRRSKT